VRRQLIVAAAMALALSGGPAAWAAPVVRNGSFERPVTAFPLTQFSAGETIDDQNEWVVHSGTVFIAREPDFEVAAGAQALDLIGSERGSVVQTLVTDAGADYRLRFFATANPDCQAPAGDKRLRLFWDGELAAILVLDGTVLNWQRYTSDLMASREHTKLRFASASEGSCGLMIDRVRIRAVP
jgi:hypothetical protein